MAEEDGDDAEADHWEIFVNRNDIQPGPILRDTAILWGLTFVGGFIIGVAGIANSARGTMAIVISNMVLGTIGFVIAGCLAPGNRWPHLAMVAFGLWLAGLLNLMFGISILQWAVSIVFIGIMMVVGGALSYAFKRDGNTGL